MFIYIVHCHVEHTWHEQDASCARCFLLVYIMYKAHTLVQQVERHVGKAFTADTFSAKAGQLTKIYTNNTVYSSIKLSNVEWEFGILVKSVLMLEADRMGMVSSHSFTSALIMAYVAFRSNTCLAAS